MCLPLGCLRCIVEIEAWIILLGGIGAFGYTIYLQIVFSKDFQPSSAESNQVWGQGLITAFWITSSCIIVNGIMGVVGGKKKSGCLLFLFNIVNMVLFLAFLVLMICGYVWAGEWNDLTSNSILTNCNNQKSNLGNAFESYSQMLCGSTCECYYSNTNVPLYPYQSNYSTTNSSLPTQVQQCPDYESDAYGDYFYVNILGQMEKNHGCSGWCGTYNSLVFYDINKPVTETSPCSDVLINHLSQIGKIIGDVSAGLMGLMGLMVIFTFCLCCHPTKKDKAYYERLAYYDEA